MSDDIVFIKDINDYNEYNKLKPVNYYKYKKVKFICSKCNCISIKTFRALKIPFICSTCTRKMVYTNESFIQKRKETNIKRYNCEFPAQSKIIQEKIKQTCLEKYGVESYLSTEKVKNELKNYCLLQYGVDNPVKSNEIKEKIKQTCLEKYGETNYNKTEISKYQHKNTCLQRYSAKTYKESEEYYNRWLNDFNKKLQVRNMEYIATINNRRYIKCLICNKEFDFSIAGINILLKKFPTSFCPYCTKLPGISYKENELYNYIKLIYDGTIIKNIKTILPNNKEIDIYLPNLKLGFEFDGTYWHADPRFYKETDIIEHKKITAKEIWERDIEKNVLCEKLGIQLVRVKEYDWINNNEYEKLRIKEIIENKLLFKNNY